MFTKTWLEPEKDEIHHPIHDALEGSKSYLKEIFEYIEFDGTKQKILNQVFSLLVDAYMDRFIIAANHNILKQKLFTTV